MSNTPIIIEVGDRIIVQKAGKRARQAILVERVEYLPSGTACVHGLRLQVSNPYVSLRGQHTSLLVRSADALGKVVVK